VLAGCNASSNSSSSASDSADISSSSSSNFETAGSGRAYHSGTLADASVGTQAAVCVIKQQKSK
jgi:hypothetical protein